MLVATELERKFSFVNKNQTLDLPDPDPSLSPQAVQNFYANTYPELISAKVTGPTIADDHVGFKFELVMGTKG